MLIGFHSIVEFASQEDSQRAIRELSEQPLLGRPVFIREVRKIFRSGLSLSHKFGRIVRMIHGSVQPQFQVR